MMQRLLRGLRYLRFRALGGRSTGRVSLEGGISLDPDCDLTAFRDAAACTLVPIRISGRNFHFIVRVK